MVKEGKLRAVREMPENNCSQYCCSEVSSEGTKAKTKPGQDKGEKGHGKNLNVFWFTCDTKPVLSILMIPNCVMKIH